MAQPKVNPHGDYTGKMKAKLQAEHAEELAKREAEISLITQQEQDYRANSTVDLTQGGPIILDGDDVQQLEGDEQMSESAHRTIRVNQDIEQMTVGAGNTYDFVVGQKYRVPRHIADHLEEKGLVWH